ncbi:MAG: hypothetical protein ACREB9_01435 [Thermoplasmata archaeon]
MRDVLYTLNGEPVTQREFNRFLMDYSRNLDEVARETARIRRDYGERFDRVDARMWWIIGLIVGVVAVGVPLRMFGLT